MQSNANLNKSKVFQELNQASEIDLISGRMKFIETYGISFPIPTYLYKGALFWPQDETFLFTAGTFMFPDESEVHSKFSDSSIPPDPSTRESAVE